MTRCARSSIIDSDRYDFLARGKITSKFHKGEHKWKSAIDWGSDVTY